MVALLICSGTESRELIACLICSSVSLGLRPPVSIYLLFSTSNLLILELGLPAYSVRSSLSIIALLQAVSLVMSSAFLPVEGRLCSLHSCFNDVTVMLSSSSKVYLRFARASLPSICDRRETNSVYMLGMRAGYCCLRRCSCRSSCSCCTSISRLFLLRAFDSDRAVLFK